MIRKTWNAVCCYEIYTPRRAIMLAKDLAHWKPTGQNRLINNTAYAVVHMNYPPQCVRQYFYVKRPSYLLLTWRCVSETDSSFFEHSCVKLAKNPSNQLTNIKPHANQHQRNNNIINRCNSKEHSPTARDTELSGLSA